MALRNGIVFRILGGFASVAVLIAVIAGSYQKTVASPQGGTTIIVDTTEDELLHNQNCSLREAILAANLDTAVDGCPAGNGADIILVPAGVYFLVIPGEGENDNLTGDLDIAGDLTIQGAGREVTILDGNNLDRVLHVVGPHQVTISGVTIRNGFSSSITLFGGGGILNELGTNLVVSDSIITGNHANHTGGGIDNAATARIINVLIFDNSAARGGGLFNDGTLTLQNLAFVQNTASITGGGLDNGGTATITNITISENDASSGGGIFNDGNLTIVNGTIFENTTAIMNEGKGTGIARFKNTIVANSTEGENCSGQGTFTSQGNNLDSGNTCVFTSAMDMSNTNPMLGPLQDNQGRTLTHALLPGSPAIDSGDNLDCPQTDQRGALRPADGIEDGIKVCDIGAYELNGRFPSFIFLPLARR